MSPAAAGHVPGSAREHAQRSVQVVPEAVTCSATPAVRRSVPDAVEPVQVPVAADAVPVAGKAARVAVVTDVPEAVEMHVPDVRVAVEVVVDVRVAVDVDMHVPTIVKVHVQHVMGHVMHADRHLKIYYIKSIYVFIKGR